MTYEQAMQQLEEIATRMERGEISIDEMAAQLKTAQKLLAYCKKRLCAADEEIQKILDKEDK